MRPLALPRVNTPVLHDAAVPPRAVGLVIGVLEALVGKRPLHQIRPHLSPDAFRAVVDYHDSGLLGGSALGRIRVQRPAAGAVEASVLVHVGVRWLACSLRLEGRDAWHCCHVHLLGLTHGRARA